MKWRGGCSRIERRFASYCDTCMLAVASRHRYRLTNRDGAFTICHENFHLTLALASGCLYWDHHKDHWRVGGFEDENQRRDFRGSIPSHEGLHMGARYVPTPTRFRSFRTAWNPSSPHKGTEVSGPQLVQTTSRDKRRPQHVHTVDDFASTMGSHSTHLKGVSACEMPKRTWW